MRTHLTCGMILCSVFSNENDIACPRQHCVYEEKP